MSESAVTDDYQGPFDPEWTLERLSRTALAQLCREYMLVAMYHDRALMPHVVAAGGQDATIRQADGEWMGASPVYTRRNKENLQISGDGVAEIFKSFQFDVGAPHHYLDFQFDVIDHGLGYFWLPYCGAHDYLRQLAANDEALVTNMCHHMEDRTFDATLAATNPSARAVPIHRPPKPDEFTGDHCRWEVSIAPADGETNEARPGEGSHQVVASSLAADYTFVMGDSLETGGRSDYSGDFDPHLRLEDFAHNVLVRQAKEFSIDVHLLMRAAYFSIDESLGLEVLDDAAPQHRAAMAPAVVARLRESLRIEGDDMEAIAKMLQVDPILVDDYVRYEVQVIDARHGRISFDPSSDAVSDDVCRSPLSWLSKADSPGFEHTVHAVNPRARVRPTGTLTWDIEIDPDQEPVTPHAFAAMVGAFGTLDFDLTERRVATPVRRSTNTEATP